MIDIKGYEGLYAITQNGMVWSHPKQHDTGKGHVSHYSGRWLNPMLNNSGYLSVVLYKDKRPKRILLHRILIETFIPNPENKPFCNHKDGNKLNNSLDNLEWCTTSENTQHASDNGLIRQKTETKTRISSEWGKKNQHHTLKSTRKFTFEQIEQIKESYKELNVFAQVGRLFGCSDKTIEKIVNNKSYQLI
jgi:hypothetical protein